MENNETFRTAASHTPGADRLKLAATAMASNMKLHITRDNGNKNPIETVNMDSVQKILDSWPATPTMAAQNMMEFYGPPNEATPSMLIWYSNGYWKRTVVYRDEVPHDFPEPHVDVLEQFIDYRIPVDKVGLIAEMDGSIVIDRTKGEVGVHCDNEGANILSLNMMHEVITGKRTPAEAREFIAKEITNYLMGQPAPYAEKFQFALPKGEQWDTDDTIVDDIALNEAIHKVKGKLGLH